MKTFKEILELKRYGDYAIISISKAVGCSIRNVRAVIRKERKDKYRIQEAFSNLIETREKLESDLLKNKNSNLK